MPRIYLSPSTQDWTSSTLGTGSWLPMASLSSTTTKKAAASAKRLANACLGVSWRRFFRLRALMAGGPFEVYAFFSSGSLRYNFGV